MSHFDKVLSQKDLVVEDNNQLKKEQRRVANFSRLIAAAREAEKAWQEEASERVSELSKYRDEAFDLQGQVMMKDREIANLKWELEHFRLRDRATQADLTMAQKRLVLNEPAESAS